MLLCPWQPVTREVTPLAAIFLTSLFIPLDAVIHSCADCSNGSTCRIETVFNDSIATCHCLQGWLGETCDARVTLSVATVTMETITLKINVDGSVPYNLASIFSVNIPNFYKPTASVSNTVFNVNQTHHQGAQNYVFKKQQLLAESDMRQGDNFNLQLSVHYWPAQHSEKCNIIPDVSRDLVTIYGLHNNTAYVYCVHTTQHDRCVPISTKTSAPVGHNCVSVKTGSIHELEVDEIYLSRLYSIILGSVSGLSLIVLIIIVVIFVKKHGFSELICSKRRKRSRIKYTTSAIQMAKLDTDDQIIQIENLTIDADHDSFLLNSPECQRIAIHPPSSPGKPNHQLVKERLRGYAVFSAKNEQTIPLSAVLEYEEDGYFIDDTLDESTDRVESLQSFKVVA